MNNTSKRKIEFENVIRQFTKNCAFTIKDYRFWVCVIITVALVVISATVFRNSYSRLIEALSDFFKSLGIMLGTLFGMETDVSGSPVIDVVVDSSVLLPSEWSVFCDKVVLWGNTFADGSNFINYIKLIYDASYAFLMVVLLLPPILMLLWVVCTQLFKKSINNDYGKISKPLQAYMRLEVRLRSIKYKCTDIFNYIKTSRKFIYLWLFIALLSLNVISIVISFFAFYYYFVMTFDVASIWTQIYKLVVDLKAFKAVPLIIWGIVAVCIICVIRKRIGYRRLWAREYCNRNFIRTLPISSLITASMGAGKGRMMTDIILSTEVMFREKALELLRECDFMFPNFNWINFELYLKDYINRGVMFNLASVELSIRRLRKMFEYFKEHNTILDTFNVGVPRAAVLASNCFGYDYAKYGLYYDDGLEKRYLFDVLENYAKLYFIYNIEDSIIVSNYAIRSDNDFYTNGNFPRHRRDFFEVDSFDCRKQNSYSRIVDYNMLRLGKKMGEDSGNVLEFGIFSLTELDKERGNMLDTMELKKLVDECNQKNDMFNASIKMSRHPAVIMNYPFVKFVSDSQRDNSVNSDFKELGNIVEILDTGEPKMLMPFFFIEELIYELVYKRFYKIYDNYRYERGDYTLFMYLFKKLGVGVKHHYDRYYNIFGSVTTKINVCKSSDGTANESKYFIQPKKIYAGRYATDSLAGYFRDRARRAKVGLSKMPKYKGVTADVDELSAQHSFFFRDITKQ